jgi:hypothetical protein
MGVVVEGEDVVVVKAGEAMDFFSKTVTYQDLTVILLLWELGKFVARMMR